MAGMDSLNLDFLFRDRSRLFWILNVTGWVGYTVAAWLGALAHEKPESYFAVILATAASGFAVTIPMRHLYQRLWSRAPFVLVLGMIAICYVIALGWRWLSNILY